MDQDLNIIFIKTINHNLPPTMDIEAEVIGLHTDKDMIPLINQTQS